MNKKIIIIILTILAMLSFIGYFLLSRNNQFLLYGEEEVYLLLNGKYQDPKVTAIYEGNDYQDKIVITNNLDSSKEGEYQITYEFKELKKTLTRKIIVSDLSEFINIKTIDNETINISFNQDKINKLDYPSNLIKTDDNTFKVEKNETYQFTIYDKYGNSLEKNIQMNKDILGFNELEMHFIAHKYYDDSILIRDNNKVIFVDGGRIETKEENLKYLNDLGIKKIDYMIGSHMEYDHTEVEAAILENFEVDNLIYPVDIYNCLKNCQCQRKRDTELLLSAINKYQKKPIKQDIPSILEIGDITLYFLGPLKLTCNDNNNSFIFILKFLNNTFMFTGDSYSSIHNTDGLLANAKKLGLENIKVDVLKFPHHGNDPMPDKTIKAISPKYIVVPNNHFPNYPIKSTINRIDKYGITMYRQSDSKTGIIYIVSDGDNISFKMDVDALSYK